MSYTEFIEKAVLNSKIGEPIYCKELARKLSEHYGMPLFDASAATSVALKRLLESKRMNGLRFYRKGIYYRTSNTPFGETGIDKGSLIRNKYLFASNGYETGLSLLHSMGLTSQMPRRREIVSNQKKGPARLDRDLDVFVRPPKTRITKENIRYLQWLDAASVLDEAPVDVDNPYKIFLDFAERNSLDIGVLFSLAYRHYGKATVLAAAKIFSEATSIH